MDKQEKAVCAAVKKWVGDEVEIELFVYYPEKYKKKKSQINLIGYEKGFITNKNRFVDAKEAMKIAVKAKQVGFIEEKTVEIRMLMNTGFSTQAKISQKLLDNWINLFLQEELKPSDLY